MVNHRVINIMMHFLTHNTSWHRVCYVETGWNKSWGCKLPELNKVPGKKGLHSNGEG